MAIAPFVVAAVRLQARFGGCVPYTDRALIELRIRDIGSHAVLTGVPSCFAIPWRHPGPLLYYVLAIPYRLLCSHSVDLLIGAALINALVVVGIAFVAHRRGGPTFFIPDPLDRPPRSPRRPDRRRHGRPQHVQTPPARVGSGHSARGGPYRASIRVLRGNAATKAILAGHGVPAEYVSPTSAVHGRSGPLRARGDGVDVGG